VNFVLVGLHPLSEAKSVVFFAGVSLVTVSEGKNEEHTHTHTQTHTQGRKKMESFRRSTGVEPTVRPTTI